MFGDTKNIEQEIINSFEKSIVDRIEAICDTWDAAKVMSLPWGVKEPVDPENAQLVIDYVTTLNSKNITLPSGNEINIIKSDVKERKGKYLLLLRYEITKRA